MGRPLSGRSVLRAAARTAAGALRQMGHIGLRAFDVVLGGPGRVTELDAHNLYNPYSADYDPQSRHMSSGRRSSGRRSSERRR